MILFCKVSTSCTWLAPLIYKRKTEINPEIVTNFNIFNIWFWSFKLISMFRHKKLNVCVSSSPAGVWTPPSCLQVYWHHAAGDLDRYVVLISYNQTVLQNQSVPTGHNECAFSSLTPGRLYTVTVETWSGSYVSSVSTHGRTSESELEERKRPGGGFNFLNWWFVFLVPAAVRNLSVSNAGTAALNVTWSAALGDVDHYEVRFNQRNNEEMFPCLCLIFLSACSPSGHRAL